MARWQHRVNLGDVWKGDLPFTELRDAIVDRMRSGPWVDRSLSSILDDLAGTPDDEAFDRVWERVYDWADRDHRLWVDVCGASRGERCAGDVGRGFRRPRTTSPAERLTHRVLLGAEPRSTATASESTRGARGSGLCAPLARPCPSPPAFAVGSFGRFPPRCIAAT